MWWIYVAVGLGVVLLLIGFILLVRTINKHKKVKFKIPVVPVENPAENKKENVEDGIVFTDDEFQDMPFDRAKVKEYESDYLDEDIDEELNNKLRKQMQFQSMMQKKKNLNEEFDEDDDFENFRNEHCYSKYFTDKGLLQAMQDMPDEVKAAIFGDVFAKIDLSTIKVFDDK